MSIDVHFYYTPRLYLILKMLQTFECVANWTHLQNIYSQIQSKLMFQDQILLQIGFH